MYFLKEESEAACDTGTSRITYFIFSTGSSTYVLIANT